MILTIMTQNGGIIVEDVEVKDYNSVIEYVRNIKLTNLDIFLDHVKHELKYFDEEFKFAEGKFILINREDEEDTKEVI